MFAFQVTITSDEGKQHTYITYANSSASAFNAVVDDAGVARVEVNLLSRVTDEWDVL